METLTVHPCGHPCSRTGKGKRIHQRAQTGTGESVEMKEQREAQLGSFFIKDREHG